jgi:DNA-binding transcriptional LysR family regulator
MSDPELMGGLNYELLFLESLKLVVRPDHPLLQDTVTLSRVMEWPVVVCPKGTVPARPPKPCCKCRGVRCPQGVSKRCRPRFRASSPSIMTTSGSSLRRGER